MPTPRKVKGNSKGEGVSKALFCEGKCDAKLEFPKGWGIQTKKPSVGAVWIFSGTTQFNSRQEAFEKALHKQYGGIVLFISNSTIEYGFGNSMDQSE